MRCELEELEGEGKLRDESYHHSHILISSPLHHTSTARRLLDGERGSLGPRLSPGNKAKKEVEGPN